MIPNCPSCSRPGENHPSRDRAVRYCPACNLVFDGLTPSAFTPPAGSSVQPIAAEEWADRVEDARAVLERTRLARRSTKEAIS